MGRHKRLSGSLNSNLAHPVRAVAQFNRNIHPWSIVVGLALLLLVTSKKDAYKIIRKTVPLLLIFSFYSST